MKRIFPILILLFVTLIFFYQFFLFQKIPLAGDLLIAEYNPWKAYSFLGFVPGSIPHKAQYFDTIRQIYPWKALVIDSLKNMEIPLWNPYNFSGSPLFANSQSSVLYPLNLLYFILPFDIGWATQVISQVLLALIFTYLYCRSIGRSIYGATFSAISYSVCLFMATFLEYNTIGHIMALLPLSLFSIEKILKDKSLFYYPLFTISLVSSIFAGHLQVFLYSAIFIFIYGFVRMLDASKKRLQKTVVFFLLFLFSILVGAIQLLPTVELIQLSARVSHNSEFLNNNLLVNINQLVLFFIPDFFGNPVSRNYILSDTYPGNALYVGLIAFIFGFFAFSFKKGIAKIYTISFLVLLFLIVRSPLTELLYKFPIPLLSSSSPTNSIFLLSFCLSILAGIGMDSWPHFVTRKRVVTGIIALLLTFGFAIFEYKIPNVKNMLLSLFLLLVSFVLLLFLKVFKNVRFLKITIILFLSFDLFFFFQKFNPFVDRLLVFPKTPIFSFLQENSKDLYRFWGYHAAGIEANYSTQYKTFSTEGYDPLYPKAYGEFIHLSKNGSLLKSFDSTTRSDAVISQDGKMDENKARKRILDFLGVKYILDFATNASSQKEFPPSDFDVAFKDNGWTIFENKKVLPRAYLADKVEEVKDNPSFEKILNDERFNPQDLVLMADTSMLKYKEYGKGEAQIVSYTQNKVVIKTKAKMPSMLVLTDTYFPGWKVFIDGRDEAIYPAYHSFRAVELPGGEHNVEFGYKPVSFSIGIILSIMGVLGVVGLVGYKRFYGH